MASLMKSPLLILVKTHRKTSAAVALVATYAALGFLLVPWVAERQLGSVLESRLGLETSLESLYFNPFSFYLALEELRLTDPQEGELLSLSHSHLNFQPSRLLLLKLQVAELAIDGLKAKVDRYSDGSTTASVLATRWQESAEPREDTSSVQPTEEASELPAAEVLSLTLNEIEIVLTDAVPVTPFSTRVTLHGFQLTDFSTLENTTGNYQLNAEFENNAPLLIDGTLSMVPLSTNGNISLQQFPLTMITRYAQDTLPLTLSSGDYGLALDYQVNLVGAVPEISISNLTTGIENLVALENGSNSAFFSIANMSVVGGRVELPQNTAGATEFALNDVDISALVNENGEVNFVRMLNQLTGSTEAAPSSSTATVTPSDDADSTPWQIELTTLTVGNLSLRLQDDSLELPLQLAAVVNGSASDISNQDGVAMPFNVSIDIASGGTVNTSGQVTPFPALALVSSLTIDQLELPAIQPYLNEYASVLLENGSVNLDTSLAINTDDPFSARGGFAVNALKVTDMGLNEDLITFEQVAIDQFDFSLAANALEVSEMTLDDLYARVIINQDGSTNIGRSIKESTPQTTDVAPEIEAVEDESAGNPFSITLGKMSFNNAAANFTDRNLPLIFDANIRKLNGSAEGLASNSQEAATLSLEGQVNEFGLVQINSSLNPFNVTQSSEIDVQFTNIEMPALTPYVIKFAGREISDGSIDLGLVYEIKDGQLEANNQMVLKDLKLGERVDQPGAMDLPLDLALALLKDGNGVIDLEVPIVGDVNDPEFDFGPAIRRTLTNVLTNIVAAPFRLLSGLIGGGETSLESIRFLPGRSDIAPPEQQILNQLAEALTQRPQLMLEVPPLLAEEDTLALKTTKVNQSIELALEALPDEDSLLTERRRIVLETLYSETSNPQPLIEIQQQNQLQRNESLTPTTETTTPPPTELDVVAYSADLRQRLVQAQNVSESELRALATARANAVVAYMTDTAEIPEVQISISDAATSSLDDDGWLLMEFGLGPAN